MTRRRSHEFSAEETAELLIELDAQLGHRGVAALISSSVAPPSQRPVSASGRLTADVDVLTRDTVVFDEAKTLGRERGLPRPGSINANVWMPPLPSGVLDPSAEPGLQVIYADDAFLFATKLIAQRAKDADDVIALAERLGLSTAPEQLGAHIRSYCTHEAALEFIVDGKNVDQEITLRTQDASRTLNRTAAMRAAAAPAEDPGTDSDRLHRSRQQEDRKTPAQEGESPDPPIPVRY